MARSTANTRKVSATKRKTKEYKEESKEVNFDDDYLFLSDESDKYQSEGETKEPPNEDGDPKSDTSGFESENFKEAKPKKKRSKTKANKAKGRLVMAMMMPHPVMWRAYLPMMNIWQRRGAMPMTLKLINALVLPRKRPMLLGLGLSASQLSPYFAYLCSLVWTKWPPAA